MEKGIITSVEEIKRSKPQVTRDRETAYRAVINTWLKASPANITDMQRIIIQNKRRKAMMRDSFGSSRHHPKDLRAGLSIPHGLYYTLVNFERMHNGKFLKDKADFIWFAKKFPQFCIAERI